MPDVKEIARDYLINCGWYKEHNEIPPDYSKVAKRDFERISMQEGGKGTQDIKGIRTRNS